MRRAMSGRRTAFALPMVVLLAMVGAIMAAVMLERQAAQQLSVNRRVARYGAHHAGRGVKEVVASWLNSVKSEAVETLLGKSGHALDIEITDGRIISIFLTEGQGTALEGGAGLDDAKAADAAGIIQRLRLAVGEENLARYVRSAGPVTVSAISAPAEVLAAAAGGVLSGADAERYAEFLVGERRDGKLMPGKLTQAANHVGASPEDRAALAAFVTDKPTLYRLTAEVRGPDRDQTGQVYIMGATKLLDRYTGLVVLENKGTGRGGGTSQSDLLQPLGAFLTWERSAPEDVPADE
jgi:hypothetical protein